MNAMSTSTIDLQVALDALHDDYTYRVNMLLDEGRDDLAMALADDFTTEAARLTRKHAA